MSGTLFVVATPIGNLEDITARALRVLREVALIAAEDTRRTSHLLARYAITTPTTSFHEHNEHQKVAQLLGRLQKGEDLALVSDAGTPTISDPGRHLIRASADAGVRVEPIPGPNAAIAALSASGFVSDEFTFLGFPPFRSKDRKEWFSRALAIGGTMVFFEAPHRIRETLKELETVVGDRPILLCRELTKTHEELVRGPISGVLSVPFQDRGEFTVVVELGHKTVTGQPERPPDDVLADELGRITDVDGLSKRSAIAAVAKRYSLAVNDVYAAIERVRKSRHST